MSREREAWPDAVKLVACVFVVLGHFTQSMVKSGIMHDGSLYDWFQATIYSFHVPLFFICSGYLYQRYSRVDSFDSWRQNVRKKALALGVPYVFFTCVTLVLKAFAGDLSNSQESGLIETLLFHPTAPYWYLYTLFFIFLIVPTAGSRRVCTVIIAAAGFAKAMSLSSMLPSPLPYAVASVCENGLWFALGMGLSCFGWLKRLDWKSVIVGFVFLPLSAVLYGFDAGSIWWFVIGLLACLCVVSSCVVGCGNGGSVDVSAFARWTMPVYLMHTIFAAGWRVVLLKLGISSPPIHIVTGLVIGFAGPVIAVRILERYSPLDFVIFPNRYIELRSKGTQ